ncbi:hypothetical protein F3Y22_tig00112044pilonHSYRG00101 [Hibiscus syriacus]|uniref:CCHC-type domain-containing protein n=1 Tax=Hibiscus syriacus TaxID=106335 RepID=A0A6A2XM61_HIBSY|nr:hypothetical protein F3Y22_tig00112044pilonHSYRG00101 [Hibiscus syriacus]
MVDEDIEILDRDVTHEVIDDLIYINFLDRVHDLAFKSLSQTVVIKLLGRCIVCNALCNRIYDLWNPSQALRIMDIENDYLLVMFRSQNDYLKVLAKVNGRIQLVEYESLLFVCFNCGTYGHASTACPSINIPSAEANAISTEAPILPQAETNPQHGSRFTAIASLEEHDQAPTSPTILNAPPNHIPESSKNKEKAVEFPKSGKSKSNINLRKPMSSPLLLWASLILTGLKLLALRGAFVSAGNFNATLSFSDRMGGADTTQPCKDFQFFLFDSELQDMHFHGPAFTWTRCTIHARLDRVLCNNYWDDIYSESVVYHLLRIRPDHRLIMLQVGNIPKSSGPKQFRYFSGWKLHVDFNRMVKENWRDDCTLSASILNFAKEAIHSMCKSKSNKGWMAIKVDLEKAFDILHWDFIKDTLSEAGFPLNLSRIIMHYITTSSFLSMAMRFLQVGLLQPTPRCPVIRVRVALRESQSDLRLYPLVGEESGEVSGALLDMAAMLRRNGRSAGGRVIDPHRSSLGTKMVDMLVCGADCKTKISYMLRFLENEDE